MSKPPSPPQPPSSRPPRRLPGLVLGALLVGVVSLGLPWGDLGQPGYAGVVRVPVIVAGLAVLLGWRWGSRRLVRVGTAFGLAAVALSHLAGSGPLAFAFAMVLLELALRGDALRHRTDLTSPIG